MSYQPTLTSLATATTSTGAEVPILGYTVWWSLSGIRVEHDALEASLEAAGFGAYLPSPPTYRKSLRRALEAWIREKRPDGAFENQGEDEGEDEEQPQPGHRRSGVLIRTISAPRAKWLVFALVAEDQNVAVLGLEYATALRILLDKEKGGMVVSSEGQGMIKGISDMIEAAAGGVTAAEAEARRVAQELLPHWRYYRQRHISGDLSRMVREIVCGEGIQRPTRRKEERASAQGKPGLGGVTVRGGGGLYFVPTAQGEALERLRALIESFPTDGRHEPYFVMQPVLDERHAKGHLARAAHAGFVDEIAALRADLERLAASTSPTEESVAARLAAYRRRSPSSTPTPSCWGCSGRRSLAASRSCTSRRSSSSCATRERRSSRRPRWRRRARAYMTAELFRDYLKSSIQEEGLPMTLLTQLLGADERSRIEEAHWNPDAIKVWRSARRDRA